MEELAKLILNKFHEFTDGYRVQMLIDRGESNTNKGSRRWISKLISSNTEQFNINLISLLEMQHHLNNPDIRLYSCVNKRNLSKAIKHFQIRQINLNTEQEFSSFYRKINDSFCSSLMKPENKDERFFLLDYDDVNKIEAMTLIDHLTEHNVKIINYYATTNGYHLITSPFNPLHISTVDNIEIKKDALLLLHTLPKGDQNV